MSLNVKRGRVAGMRGPGLSLADQADLDTALATANNVNRAARSPFQPSSNFTAPALSQTQLRNLLVDVDLSDEVYDEAKFYSFAIINKTSGAIEFQLYHESAPNAGDYVLVRVYSLTTAEGYDPTSDDVQTIRNAYGRIAFVASAIPNGNYSGLHYASSGLDDHVFREGYSIFSQFSEVLPRLVLPSVLHAIVGREFNLYFDAMTLLPDVGLGQPDFLFDVVCAIGSSTRRSYRVTPESGHVGTHALTVLVYNNAGELIETKATTLLVKAAANAGSTKRILSIGDSTTDDTSKVTQRLQINLAALSGVTPTFIGTHGLSPYNHEARTGQSLAYYANGADRLKFTVSGFPTPANFWPNWTATAPDETGYIMLNEERDLTAGAGTIIGAVWEQPDTGGTIEPGWTGTLEYGETTFSVSLVEAVDDYSIFKNGGTGSLSFASYMTRFGFAGCDLLTIDLGINDSYGALQSEATQLAKITDAKAIITSYLSYNAAGKVMVCLPKSCASTRNFSAPYDAYRLNIHRMRELLIEHFDLGAFHANVVICASGLAMDRYYGYPLTTAQPVAARYSETETVHGDQIHPREQGYDQVADAMTATVAALLA